MFFSFSHDLLRHIWKHYQQEEKAAPNCTVIFVYLQVAPYQYVRRLEIAMDNPIAAGGKGKIVEISPRFL